MARENQGLQIGLIVFVMLTIALGVTTYLFYRNWDEAAIKAKAASDEAAKNSATAAKNAEDAAELKRMIGVAATENVATFRDGPFKEDMKNFGGAWPEAVRFYRPLLEKMAKTINEKNDALTDAKAEVPKRDDEYKKRVAANEQQVKQFQDAASKASRDLAEERSKFKNERERITQESATYQANLQTSRKTASDTVAKIEAKLVNATKIIKELRNTKEELGSKIAQLTEGTMGTANGEISWVNQRGGTVWINLGRADALSRQVTFSVFPADSTDVKRSKAGIEVTQILGDHLAEARILDDDANDPIIPGDKIFTPLWSPGERRHFALAGFIDLDGDGQSDLATVTNLITAAGGVVDCYIADAGKDKNKVKGAIDVNTNCLIVGAAPDEKGDPGQRDAFTRILREADQFRLPKLQIGDFLQRIGWKNMSSVVRYGRGANPNDFRAKADDAVPRKSNGNTSDVFKDREAPAAGGGNRSYYRF